MQLALFEDVAQKLPHAQLAISSLDPIDQLPQPWKQWQALLPTLPNLTRVSVEAQYVYNAEALSTLLSALPHLTEVAVDIWFRFDKEAGTLMMAHSDALAWDCVQRFAPHVKQLEFLCLPRSKGPAFPALEKLFMRFADNGGLSHFLGQLAPAGVLNQVKVLQVGLDKDLAAFADRGCEKLEELHVGVWREVSETITATVKDLKAWMKLKTPTTGTAQKNRLKIAQKRTAQYVSLFPQLRRVTVGGYEFVISG